MTEPGSVVPPSPSWWIRTGRSGINTSSYGWDGGYAQAVSTPQGTCGGGYGYSSAATGKRPASYNRGSFTFDTSTQTLSMAFNAATGTTVFVVASTSANRTPTATFGGESMDVVANVAHNNAPATYGRMVVFAALGVGIGAPVTVEVDWGASVARAAIAVTSYFDVNSLGTAQTTYGGGTGVDPTQTASANPDETLWQSFSIVAAAARYWTDYTQTLRINNSLPILTQIVGQIVGDADGGTDVEFGATVSSSTGERWAGVAIPLR